jgi:hypothetical protein
VLERVLSNSVSVACCAAGDVTVVASSSAPRPEAAAVTVQSRAKATEGKAGMAGGTPTVRQTTAGTGLRVGAASAVLPATSEFMDATAGETAPNSQVRTCSTDAANRGQSRHEAVTAGRDRQPNFSSGDSLGIHEPGSITWGDRDAMTAPSGRARDRAECPAVTGGLSDPSRRSALACIGQAAVTRSPANGGGHDEVTGSDCKTHSGEDVATSQAASSFCNADGRDITSFLDRRNITASRTFAASEITSAETSSSIVQA